MSRQITAERMLQAGFVLTDCSDGKFWVLAEEPGESADRIAAICGEFLSDMDNTEVMEDIVLQCAADYSEPALYMDGYLWSLPRWEFSGIISRLSHLERAKKEKKSLFCRLAGSRPLSSAKQTEEGELPPKNEALK